MTMRIDLALTNHEIFALGFHSMIREYVICWNMGLVRASIALEPVIAARLHSLGGMAGAW
ncbi:hypothetical protein [Collimonas sp. OK412]|uniref:hypothetical protein n=1 Tax=Collimonas sp. (strain OK412) TaxID=1801619 RepID=UPI001113458B|nr:hypothetical protein [Collimonas sp. OK412]